MKPLRRSRADLRARNKAWRIWFIPPFDRRPKASRLAGAAEHALSGIAELYEMDSSSCELHSVVAFDGAHERWLSTLYSGGRLVIRDGCLWTPEQTYAALHDTA